MTIISYALIPTIQGDPEVRIGFEAFIFITWLLLLHLLALEVLGGGGGETRAFKVKYHLYYFDNGQAICYKPRATFTSFRLPRQLLAYIHMKSVARVLLICIPLNAILWRAKWQEEEEESTYLYKYTQRLVSSTSTH